MRYREFAPVPALAPFVDCLWTLEGRAAGGDAAEPVLPDGRPELILHFGDPFERLESGAVAERQPAVIYAGQLTRQLLLRPVGAIGVLGVRFRPHGGAGILAMPQSELAGVPFGLDAVSPPLVRALRSVRDTTDDPAAATMLVQQVLRCWIDGSSVDPRVGFAVDAIRRTRGRISIDSLADGAGLTCRHLERRFLAAVGITPKRLARLARFQHALQLLGRQDSPRPGTETAAACGYADQSHFIRDFRQLAGCSPGEHLLRHAQMTSFFIQGDRG